MSEHGDWPPPVTTDDAKEIFELIMAEATVREFSAFQVVGLMLALAASLFQGAGGSFKEFVRAAERAYRDARRAGKD